MSTAGTTTSDQVCTACDDGEYSDTADAASCSAWRAFARKYDAAGVEVWTRRLAWRRTPTLRRSIMPSALEHLPLMIHDTYEQHEEKLICVSCIIS